MMSRMMLTRWRWIMTWKQDTRGQHRTLFRRCRGNQAAGPAPCRGRGPGTTMRQLSTAHLIAFELLRQRPDCTGRYPQAVAVPGFA